jgi:putative transposase
VDLNLENFSTDSDGYRVENPRFFRKAEKKLARLQKQLARKRKGSKRREKARVRVARARRKIRRQREDFAHKQALRLIRDYDVIFLECLLIANMIRNPHLAKSIGDVAWGLFLRVLEGKAESAGRLALNVDPKGTTQECSQCHQTVPKGLSVRWRFCRHRGFEVDRDHNSAFNILDRGEVLISAAGQAVAARGGRKRPVKREPARECIGSPGRTPAPKLSARSRKGIPAL